MIELNRLTRHFDGVTAVDGVTLSIPRGQILGYLGPNGAGKTTTVKMLTGMIQPSAGTASVAGFDVKENPLEVKRRIGLVPESGAVYQSLSPREYLTFVGRLYGIEEDSLFARMSEICQFFGLSDDMDRRMTEFSRGMRQKVVITGALLHRPDVLFLDEPLSGLDANAALLFKELIRNLKDEGKTIFYCSHILEVVETLCDRVVIIDKGCVVADGSVEALKEMTNRSSLESVFSKLTHAGDLSELAKAFSKQISE